MAIKGSAVKLTPRFPRLQESTMSNPLLFVGLDVGTYLIEGRRGGRPEPAPQQRELARTEASTEAFGTTD